jgi:hypothetical protein
MKLCGLPEQIYPGDSSWPTSTTNKEDGSRNKRTIRYDVFRGCKRFPCWRGPCLTLTFETIATTYMFGGTDGQIVHISRAGKSYDGHFVPAQQHYKAEKYASSQNKSPPPWQWMLPLYLHTLT